MTRTVLNCMRIALIVLAVAACARQAPEQRLRADIAAMQQAVDHQMGDMIGQRLARLGGFARAGVIGDGNVAE